MKLWIAYVVAFLTGIGSVILFREYALTAELVQMVSSFLIPLGCILTFPFVFFSVSSGIASLRYGSRAGTMARSTVVWSIITTSVCALIGALLFLIFPATFPHTLPGSLTPEATATFATETLFSLKLPETWIPSNAFAALSQSGSTLLFVIALAIIFGFALKPTLEAIRPAYTIINSLSEVMFRLARIFIPIGACFLVFNAGAACAFVMNEQTLLEFGKFTCLILMGTAAVAFIVLPMGYGILTGLRKNPWGPLSGLLVPALSALATGNILYALHTNASSCRHELEVPKRVAGTVIPIHSLIGRGGSACISVIAICTLYYHASGSIPSLALMGAIIGGCILLSYICASALGYEVFFIAAMAMFWFNIPAAGSVVSVMAILPLLNGIASMLDTLIAGYGACYTDERLRKKEVLQLHGEITV